jgi:hypothetical protein
MTNDGTGEGQRAIAELLRTPVGRRWLLDPALGVAEPSLSRFDPVTRSGAQRLRR